MQTTSGKEIKPRGRDAASGEGSKTQVPSVTLPEGGGAIRGIGEKFTANPATGSGSFSIPIPVSQGRAGFTPQLSINYDSGNGNGLFGMGWSLDLPSIKRKTDKGLPKYDDANESDEYLIAGAEDLVPVLNSDGTVHQANRVIDGTEYNVCRYRPRTEGLFARIERWTRKPDGDIHWRSISKDNITTLYGLRESNDNDVPVNSRIADPKLPYRVFE